MSHWWCCCGGERDCVICSDDFNRSDSTNIGSVLVEVSGDSEIQSQCLWMPSGAVVRTATCHPISDESGIVFVTAKNTVAGGKYRVLINYNKTTGQSHWAELEQTADSQIVRLDTGSSLTNDSSPPGNDVEMVVCYTGLDDGMLVVFLPTKEVWDQADPIAGGDCAGLENSGEPDILWDDFRFEEHYITNDDCEHCACSCDFYMPHHGSLIATFSATGCISPIDGVEVELSLEHKVAALPSDLTWAGSEPEDECEVCLGLRLWCVESAPPRPYDITEAWLLTSGCATIDGTMPSLACDPSYINPLYEIGWDQCRAWPTANSTCDPFYLEFGPFPVTDFYVWDCCDEGEEGEYWIVITEAP